MKNYEEVLKAFRVIDEAIYNSVSALTDGEGVNDYDQVRMVEACLTQASSSFRNYLFQRAMENGRRAATNIDRFYVIRRDKELTPYHLNHEAREFSFEELALEAWKRYNEDAASGKQRFNKDKIPYDLYKFNHETKKFDLIK